MDYAFLKYKMHNEDFKALVSKYDLVNDEEYLNEHVALIVDKIFDLYNKFETTS